MLIDLDKPQPCNTMSSIELEDRSRTNIRTLNSWMTRIRAVIDTLNLKYETSFYAYYLGDTQDQPEVKMNVTAKDHETLLEAARLMSMVIVGVGQEIITVLSARNGSEDEIMRFGMIYALENRKVQDQIVALNMAAEYLLHG